MFKIFTNAFTLYIKAFMCLFISTCSTKELGLHQKLHIEFKKYVMAIHTFYKPPSLLNLFISMGQPYCTV